jgi:hypothetical protein
MMTRELNETTPSIADSRPVGNWPQTGVEEINGNLLEEDF